VGITVAIGVFVSIAIPVYAEFKTSFAMKDFKKYGVIGAYRHHYHHFFEKVDNLATADLQEEKLLRELASTKRELEIERAKATESEQKSESHQVAGKLKKQAGSHLARMPEAISYRAPKNMQTHQLVVLGMEYFRKHDYEKSAVIFHDLMTRKEETAYQRPDHFMVTAISWYKLKHFELASTYLDRVEKTAEKGGSLYRQAILWKSLVKKSVGDGNGSQKLLTRLISYHPQSEEASLINGKRKPSSLPKVLEHQAEPVHADQHSAPHGVEKAHGEHGSHHKADAHHGEAHGGGHE
jgi:hypothetical protein